MDEQEITMEEAWRRGRWVIAWQDESGKELRSLVIPDLNSPLEPIGETVDTPPRIRNVRILAAPTDASASIESEAPACEEPSPSPVTPDQLNLLPSGSWSSERSKGLPRLQLSASSRRPSAQPDHPEASPSCAPQAETE